MTTSLVIAIIHHDENGGYDEYLFVNPGKYENEEDPLVRLETTTGLLTKEQAKQRLSELALTKFNNKDAQVQSPISIRSPSGSHETWKSRVYIQNYPWGFVKGGCNKGENPVVCAQREFREETTLQIEDLSRFRRLIIGDRNLNVYQLDLNVFEKRDISMGLENKIKNLKYGEIFDYTWSHPREKPDHIVFNTQSQIVLDHLIRTPLVPGRPPLPPQFPSLEAPKYKIPQRLGGNTRRRKNGKKRRHSRTHI
jgi:8-oxo-dGTP pyrophosphatase MutT (NUDIX family)